MPRKRIVICADGTWNDPEKKHPTNVMQVARAIRPEDDDGVQQVVFYDWGVGSYDNRILGGALGLGLSKNIEDCYRFIVHNYDAGDELFLFGFSRGAYTVRSLAGLLNKCGILPRCRAKQIPCAYEFYKQRRFKPRSPEAEQWRTTRGAACGEVRFVGVWDTVGFRGIPASIRAIVHGRDPFYDAEPGSNVRVARHAVAIDERRKDFTPTLWSEKQGVDVKQVWFAGVHSDIGGGGRPKNERLLSDLALAWMAAEAERCGLTLEPHLNRDTRGLDKEDLHRSYRNLWVFRGKKVRDVPEDALVHVSVKTRHDAFKCEKKEKDRYEPKALESWLNEKRGWDSAEFVGSPAGGSPPGDESSPESGP